MTRLQLVLPLLSAFALACGTPLPDADPIALDEEGKGNVDGPCEPSVYPCGPYGTQPGATMRNLELPGRRDINGNGSLEDEDTEMLSLADYYADKSIKAIVITSSAEWCVPCQNEQPGLKTLYNEYKDSQTKVAIFEAVIEDVNSAPADMTVAMRWAKEYGLPFDVLIDPTRLLGPYYDINAFPMNMVVRTSDMKIVWQKNGLAEGELRQQIEQVLAQ